MERIIVHEEYSNQTVDNDIALIKTFQPIMITKWNNNKPQSTIVRAISLPSYGQIVKPNKSITITGWGYMHENAMKFSPKLQKITIQVLDRAKCNQIFAGEITENMFCAATPGLKGDKDACQGDSGGPVVNKHNQLIGLVSWGIGCARKDLPGVYTLVSQYVHWIRFKIENPESKYIPEKKKISKGSLFDSNINNKNENVTGSQQNPYLDDSVNYNINNNNNNNDTDSNTGSFNATSIYSKNNENVLDDVSNMEVN